MLIEPSGMWRRIAALTAVCVGLWCVVLSGQVSIPPQADRSVYDYAGVLAPADIVTMEQQHRSLFAQTEVAVVIVIIDTLEGENASDFGLRIAESWQPGNRATERGIVVVLAVDDRDVAIQTGYGAEGFLPDARTGAILDIAIPALVLDDWSSGVMSISQALVGMASSEFGVSVDGVTPVPRMVRGRDSENPGNGLFGLLGMLVMGYLFFRHPNLFFLLMLSGMGRGMGGGGFRGGGFGGGGGVCCGGGGGANAGGVPPSPTSVAPVAAT